MRRAGTPKTIFKFFPLCSGHQKCIPCTVHLIEGFTWHEVADRWRMRRKMRHCPQIFAVQSSLKHIRCGVSDRWWRSWEIIVATMWCTSNLVVRLGKVMSWCDAEISPMIGWRIVVWSHSLKPDRWQGTGLVQHEIEALSDCSGPRNYSKIDTAQLRFSCRDNSWWTERTQVIGRRRNGLVNPSAPKRQMKRWCCEKSSSYLEED